VIVRAYGMCFIQRNCNEIEKTIVRKKELFILRFEPTTTFVISLHVKPTGKGIKVEKVLTLLVTTHFCCK